MRVLILSANTGGGHNSAARAIGEALASRGVEYDVRDALAFLSETVSQVVSNGHNALYRYLPKLFGVGYRFEENHSPKLLYESMAPGAKKLNTFIREGGYDAIVCSHLFGSMMVTEAYRKYGLDVPQYFVPTDYTCYPGASTVEVKAVFLPAPQLRQAFIDGGMEESCLVDGAAIPISAAFRQPIDRLEARRRLGLPEEGLIAMLCCGSMGCGNIHRIAGDFLAALPENATLVVICGHNVRSYRQLSEQENPHMVVVGFTNRIAEYMAAADVCVSKPGGLSTTEMLSMQVPMVLILAVPGCESRNLTFLQENDLAVGVTTWPDAIAATAALLQSPERREAMREKMGETSFAVGAEAIAAYVHEQYEQK